MADNATIGALRVVLGLDTAQFQTGLKGAKNDLKSFENNVVKLDFAKGFRAGVTDIKRSMAAAAGATGAFGAALSGLGLTGVAAAASIAVAFTETRKALQLADQISDTAKRLAVSTDALQEYRYAVHALGGEYEDADAALAGFSKAFGLAQAGFSKKATKPFELLGLDPKSFKTTEDALHAVIAAIAALGSTAEQAALADKLGIGAMLPAIRDGVVEIDRLREAAHRAGFVMDASLVAKAGEANDRFEDLVQILNVEVKSAFVDLSPALEGLLGLIVKMGAGARDLVGSFRSIGNRSDAVLHDEQADLEKKISRLTFGREYRNARGDLTAGAQTKIAGLTAQSAAIQQELASRAAAAKPAAPKPGGTELRDLAGADAAKAAAKAAAERAEASARAIEQATKAEYGARIALVGDIQTLARLKKEEIDYETTSANEALAKAALDKKITPAAAAAAVVLNNRTAIEKKALVDREAEAAADAKRLDQKDQLNGYYDRILAIQADAAGTAAQQGAIELKALQRRQAAEADRLKTETARKVQSGEISQAEADELVAAQRAAQFGEQIAQDLKAREDVEHERAQRAQDALELQIDELSAQAGLLRSQFARGAVELKILALRQELERQALEEVSRTARAGSPEKIAADKRLAALGSLQAAETEAAKADHRLVDAMGEASDAISAIAGAFKSHDWARLTNALQAEIETIQASFANFGTAGGLATLGSAAGQIIGGRTGRAVGGGLGIAASGIGLGASLGSAASLGLFGGASGAILGASTFLGPVAIAAGAAYALYELLKGQPTNAGAGVALSPTQVLGLSGDRRTRETEGAATGAAGAILQGEATLKAAGITLASTVTGLVIGTRDLSQIYLSNGQTLTAAVGDAAAATDTALKGVLAGATYASEAQKSLVQRCWRPARASTTSPPASRPTPRRRGCSSRSPTPSSTSSIRSRPPWSAAARAGRAPQVRCRTRSTPATSPPTSSPRSERAARPPRGPRARRRA
jgi:hypothetical protein